MSNADNLTGTRPAGSTSPDKTSSSTSGATRTARKGQDPEKFKKILDDAADPKKQTSVGATDEEDLGEEIPSLFGLVGKPKTPNLKAIPEGLGMGSDLTASEKLLTSAQTPAQLTSAAAPQTPLLTDDTIPLDDSSSSDDSTDASTIGAMLQGTSVPSTPLHGASMDSLSKSAQGSTKAVVPQFADSDKQNTDKFDATKDPNLSAAAKAFGNIPSQTSAQTLQASESQAAQTSQQIRTADLAAIVNQIVSAITTVVTKDMTTTTITLQNPPLFAGATVQITEFNSAKNEFNITFAGLSPDARRLVELPNNQMLLRQSLIDKGYTMQNVTIESELRPISLTTGATTNRSSERDQTFKGNQEEADQDQRFM